MMTPAVIRGDARALPLADDSVDLVISSPPYFALRSYQDGGEHYPGQIGSEATPAEFVDALIEVTRECVRVLKPSGSLWINLGDKYQATSFAPQKRGKDASGVLRPTVTKECERCGTEFTGGPGRRFCSSYCGGIDNSPRAERGGIPTKSLVGIPWRYALRCIDTTRTGHLHIEAVREVIDDLATGVIDQRTAHRRIDALEEAAEKGSPGLGLILRAEVIWAKPNGLPESVTDRVRRSHEVWFHMVTQPRYYSAVDEIREAQAEPWRSTGRVENRGVRRSAAGVNDGFGLDGHTPREYNPLGKLPGSVWTIPTEPLKVPAHLGVDHFAAFPLEWPRRIIQGWSPPGVCTACGEGRRPVATQKKDVYHGAGRFRNGAQQVKDGADTVGWAMDEKWRTTTTITGYACACGHLTEDGSWTPTNTSPRSAETAKTATASAASDATGSAGAKASAPPTRSAIVLDPFGGTGTTALAARALGRHGISVDMSQDYSRLARWRTTDEGELAKAMRVDKPAVQVDGQGSLLDFLEGV
jgi:SAM-dependent methyltransferase